MMLELQAQGCHNINFVTPEHVVPQIIEALPLAIGAAWNCPSCTTPVPTIPWRALS
jgi:putative pyruvate formate lyase activating enzyme